MYILERPKVAFQTMQRHCSKPLATYLATYSPPHQRDHASKKSRSRPDLHMLYEYDTQVYRTISITVDKCW